MDPLTGMALAKGAKFSGELLRGFGHRHPYMAFLHVPAAIIALAYGTVTGFGQLADNLPHLETEFVQSEGEGTITHIFTIEDFSVLGANVDVENSVVGKVDNLAITDGWTFTASAEGVAANMELEQSVWYEGDDITGTLDRESNIYTLPLHWANLFIETKQTNGSSEWREFSRGVASALRTINSAGQGVGAVPSSQGMALYLNGAQQQAIRMADRDCPAEYLPHVTGLIESNLEQKFQDFAEGLVPGVKVDFVFVDAPEQISPGDIPSRTVFNEQVDNELERAGATVNRDELVVPDDIGETETNCHLSPEMQRYIDSLEQQNQGNGATPGVENG